VTKLGDGQALMSALLDIFAYAGKVNALLVTLAMMEFDSEILSPEYLLRTNLHVTV
jgi:hypothetical protein